jgi:hypothetical protein
LRGITAHTEIGAVRRSVNLLGPIAEAFGDLRWTGTRAARLPYRPTLLRDLRVPIAYDLMNFCFVHFVMALSHFIDTSR